MKNKYMKNKYKVELTKTNTYCLDFFADSEDEAIELAKDKFIKIQNDGIQHYYETGDEEIKVKTYNVTDTDDPFFSLN